MHPCPDFLEYDTTWASLGRGMMGYDNAVTNEYLVKRLTSSTRKDMGTHLIYSGKSLNEVGERMNKFDLLKYHYLQGDTIKRVDIAVDMIGAKIPLNELIFAFRNGHAQTRARKAVVTQDLCDSGYTLYIGSKVKRKKLDRIYDKGIEQGVDFDWMRVELQLMGASALDATKKLIECSHDNRADMIRGMVKSFCHFPTIPLWVQMFDIIPVNVKSHDYKKGDTQQWLMTKVLPTLVRECYVDMSFWAQFMMKFSEDINTMEMGEQSDV